MAEFEQARDRGEQVSAPQPGPFDRRAQEKRAARADRDLALLGRVNPLALEEFAALEERHQFLSTQLEDLKATRRDLLTVVKEVDERILEVFTSAFQDVAAEFETVFAALFPGGEGRLVLTDPEDLLHSGVDVEARPPGKKVNCPVASGHLPRWRCSSRSSGLGPARSTCSTKSKPRSMR
jgi:chromosome segregation protein